jgi:hypothetical protein
MASEESVTERNVVEAIRAVDGFATEPDIAAELGVPAGAIEREEFDRDVITRTEIEGEAVYRVAADQPWDYIDEEFEGRRASASYDTACVRCGEGLGDGDDVVVVYENIGNRWKTHEIWCDDCGPKSVGAIPSEEYVEEILEHGYGVAVVVATLDEREGGPLETTLAVEDVETRALLRGAA